MSGTSAAGAPGAAAFTYGRNVQVQIVNPLAPGNVVDLQFVTGIRGKPNYTPVKRERIDALVIENRLPHNWAGEIDMTRINPNLDALVGIYELNWKQLGIAPPLVTMYLFYAESTGAVSRYMFQNVCLWLMDDGHMRGDDVIDMKLGWVSSQRVLI